MIVAFTGHRPERLQVNGITRINEVWEAIQNFLMTEKPDMVISGMAQGVDQLAAGWAQRLAIPWTAAVPFRGQHERWPKNVQHIYTTLLDTASKVEVITEKYHGGVYHIRDRWMVDNCDLLAAVWDGVEKGGTWETIRYARQIGREIRYLEWR